MLKTAAAPAGLEAWHDLAVHADRGWLRVDLDRVPVIETEVGGLVAAETTDFRAGSSDAVYADVRLVPWQRARVDQIRGALQVKKAPALKPEHPPFAVTPSPVAPRVVPLRSVHYDHPGKWAKDAARIDPGSIPPNYVHTWVLDVAGIAALDFHPYAGNTFQLDAADRLSFFDLDGLQQDPPQPLVVITPASKSNELRIDLSKARTLPLHGKTYCRVFLQLETSPAVKPRRLRLEALLNETANDGDEEILLLGDDLDPTAPYIYPAVDSQGTPTPGISSPFHNDTETGFHAYPPTLEEDGWFLLGRNLTDRSKLFYSLVYYNEARGLLRIFLYNLELPTNVTGFTLTASLVGLAPKPTTPGGPSYLTGQELEGAFFPLHPNPNKWSSARVPLPTWFHGSWTCVEIPIAYPMGSNLPIDLALASPRAPGLYRALYEEPLARGQRVVALRLQVDSYDMGKLEGEWHGKAIGEAIQTLGKSPNGNGFISTDLLKGAAKAGGDIFKGGKKIYEGIKTLEKDTKKNAGNGDDLAKKLSGLVSLGSSVFSGAFGVASAAYSFIDGLFATPRPLTLSIELELSGKLEGTILTEHTPGPFWMCYLPGRFPVEEAYPRGLQVEADVLSNAVPTYDRPIGLFGYAYNPAELPFRMLRWEAGQTAGAPAFVFPAKPTPDLQAGPLSSQQASPLVERFLPVIYNEYSEIVLATPVILGVESEEASLEGETAQTGSAPAEWKKRYRWLSDHAWKAHVVPEPNDASFPSAVQELIGPGFCEMSIVAYLGGLETVYPPLVSTVFANVLPMPEGMVMQIEPKAGIAPYTYRDFPTKELRNFKAMQWYGCRIDANGPGPTARPFEPDDPFPVQDVLFEWAHEYFYYARSRQRADGSVPALRATAHFRSPVTMHVERVASGSSVVPELVVHEIPSAMLR